jgi:hypothetical protein
VHNNLEICTISSKRGQLNIYTILFTIIWRSASFGSPTATDYLLAGFLPVTGRREAGGSGVE